MQVLANAYAGSGGTPGRREEGRNKELKPLTRQIAAMQHEFACVFDAKQLGIREEGDCNGDQLMLAT